MAKKKRASLQDIIHKRQQREFVGRSEQLDRFRANLHRSWDDDQRLFLFNVYGQGGVGKSTLLERFRQIANDAGAISALVDEQEMDVPAVMASFAEQFKKQGYELKQFEARYRIYRQKREELEADPEAPPGLAGFAARVLTRATAHVVRHTVPGSGVVLGLVNEDELAAQAEAWVEFVRRRLANNKDEVQLLLKPNEILTPVFLNELNEINDEVTLVLIFDTYERTSDYLDAWLRNVLNGRYGEVPLNILVIIGGRDALDRDLWIPFTGIMASLSLEPFTEDEARDYLERKGVHDEQVIDIILSLSDRLPLLVAMLAAESPDDPTQIGDASGTAIDRFLKWVDDPLRRRIALDAALPHYLNYDVFAVLVPQETEFHFNWLKKTPFVKEKSEGWVYHEIVRTQMLRYKQRNSPQEWEELHEKLAEYFRDKRDAMQLTRDEGIIRDTWRRSESEFIYHTACIAPYVGFDALLSHLIAILGAGRATQAFYLYCSELILQAAKETSSEGLELWGNRLVKGIVAYNSRNYPASIELFTELVSYFRKDSNSKACALRWRGQVYRLVKNYKSALDDLEEAASLLPLDIRILAYRGLLYSDLGNYEHAASDYTHAIELSEGQNYNAGWIFSARGIVLRLLGRFKEAILDFNAAIAINPNLEDAYANRGETHRLMDNFDQALKDFNQAIVLRPSFVWALVQRGIVNRFLGRYALAIQNFEEVIHIDPAFRRTRDERAYTLKQMGEFPKAIQDLNWILDVKPMYPWALMQRGLCRQSLGSLDRALADFEHAIEIAPEDYWVHISRGKLLRLQKSFSAALSDFARAVELGDIEGRAQYELAVTNFALGQSEEAKAYLLRAIEKAEVLIDQQPYVRNAFNLALYNLLIDENKAKSLYIATLQKEPPLDRVNDAFHDLEELTRIFESHEQVKEMHQLLQKYLEEYL